MPRHFKRFSLLPRDRLAAAFAAAEICFNDEMHESLVEFTEHRLHPAEDAGVACSECGETSFVLENESEKKHRVPLVFLSEREIGFIFGEGKQVIIGNSTV